MRSIQLSALFCSVILSGCASLNRGSISQSSTPGTTLLGAATGALIGEHNDEPLAGALIGGTLGALASESIDAAEQRSANQYADKLRSDREYQRRQAVTLDQILEMTQAGVDDAVVIAHIQNKGAAQALNTEDIILLSKSQVGADVIKAYQSPDSPTPQQPPTLQSPNYGRPDAIFLKSRYPVPFGPVPATGFHIGLDFGS